MCQLCIKRTIKARSRTTTQKHEGHSLVLVVHKSGPFKQAGIKVYNQTAMSQEHVTSMAQIESFVLFDDSQITNPDPCHLVPAVDQPA